MAVQSPTPLIFNHPVETQEGSITTSPTPLPSEQHTASESMLHSMHILLFCGGFLCSSICILDIQTMPNHLAPKSPNNQALLFMEWRCLQHAQAKLDAKQQSR